MLRFARFYFDPRGRVSRKAFWFQYALVGAVLRSAAELIDSIWRATQTGSDVLLTFGAGIHFPVWNDVWELNANSPVVSLFILVWLWPPFAISAKRLHDTGRSARHWLATYVLLGVVCQLTAFLGHGAGIMFASDGTPAPLLYLLGAVGIVVVAAQFAVGLLPGKHENNQFGPNPLDAESKNTSVA